MALCYDSWLWFEIQIRTLKSSRSPYHSFITSSRDLSEAGMTFDSNHENANRERNSPRSMSCATEGKPFYPSFTLLKEIWLRLPRIVIRAARENLAFGSILSVRAFSILLAASIPLGDFRFMGLIASSESPLIRLCDSRGASWVCGLARKIWCDRVPQLSKVCLKETGVVLWILDQARRSCRWRVLGIWRKEDSVSAKVEPKNERTNNFLN